MGLFQAFLNHKMFVKKNAPIFKNALKKARKITKYFILPAIKQIKIHSNSSSTQEE